MPKIVVEQGKDSGAEALVVDNLTVGRDLACGIVIHDQQASRHHCRFEARGDKLVVKDLKSRNGILVNGARTEEAELRIGDRVTIGACVLKVVEGVLGSWSGKTVSGYRFLDKIGEGGMGEVYRAEQLSMRRQVAAKVLSAKLHENPKYVERLLKEARAAAQFNNPGLIQVHDVLQAPEITFFSMELVQGQTLRESLRRGTAPVAQVLSVARQVLEALKYAHAKGIVHHDVKPENIMVGEDGAVKLADLGIAQPAGAQLQASASGKRVLLGTPQYMSPDQITGDRVDPRFDLYSLGATCYHALSGRSPFRGASAEEIVKQVCAGPPPTLASLSPGLPADVTAFVENLMTRDPEARIPSAEAALKALAALQAKYGADQPGTATTGSGTARVRAPDAARKARKSGRWAAAFVLGAAGIGGIVYGARFLNHLPEQSAHPPPPVPPPPVEPPAPPVEAPEARLLAEGRAALAKGDLETAQASYRSLLLANPDDPEAKEGMAAVALERKERKAESLWDALKQTLDQAPEADRIKRLGAFLAEYPKTRAAAEANLEMDRIQVAQAARATASLADLSRVMNQAQELVRDPDQPRFQAALLDLQAFRQSEAFKLLPTGKPRDQLAELEQGIQAERQAFWTRKRGEFQLRLDKGEFAQARGVFDALVSLEGEGWKASVRKPLEDWQKALDQHVDRKRKEAGLKREQFDFAGTQGVYEDLAMTLQGTPYAGRGKAWAERARILAAAQKTLPQQITAAPKEKHYRIPVPNLGTGRVKSADATGIDVILPGGATTSVAWKKLDPPSLLPIFRHYLDLRETDSHVVLLALCWEGGLWEEGAKELEKARSALGSRPGFEEEFLREKATPGPAPR